MWSWRRFSSIFTHSYCFWPGWIWDEVNFYLITTNFPSYYFAICLLFKTSNNTLVIINSSSHLLYLLWNFQEYFPLLLAPCGDLHQDETKLTTYFSLSWIGSHGFGCAYLYWVSRNPIMHETSLSRRRFPAQHLKGTCLSRGCASRDETCWSFYFSRPFSFTAATSQHFYPPAFSQLSHRLRCRKFSAALWALRPDPTTPPPAAPLVLWCVRPSQTVL